LIDARSENEALAAPVADENPRPAAMIIFYLTIVF
jgi:hypothetical protein